jgi:hypothetical protein
MKLNIFEERAKTIAMVITGINVLVATGFSVIGLINPKLMLPPSAITTDASFIFALYAAARTIPLALFTLVVIYRRSSSNLIVLGFLAGCIQFVDGFVGIYQQDIAKSVGPFILAALQFGALYIMNSSLPKDTKIASA